MNSEHQINSSPDIRFGKPCIEGTRIAVADVIAWLNSGMSIDEILDDFPELSKEKIDACISYHHENNK